MTTVNKSKLLSLAHAYSGTDPTLYRILKELIDAQDGIVREIEKIVRQATEVREEERSAPPEPLDFVISPTRRNIILSWNNPDLEVVTSFDVRKGTDWESADRLLTTFSTRIVLDPIAVGDHTYMVRSISVFGIISDTSAIATITIPRIADIVLNIRTIDNAVLLDWEIPESFFDISHYIIQKDGVVLGQSLSTFHTIIEISGGTFIYEVTPVDIAGNEGTTVCAEATVSKPRDYVIDGTAEDAFDGVVVRGLVDNLRLITPIKTDLTWQSRFAVHDTLQELIDAGYNYWLEPSAASGTYENTFDFGEIFTSRLVSFRYNFIPLVGSVGISVQISISSDGSTFTAPVEQLQLFADSVRYVKVKIAFTPTDSAIISVTRMAVLLEVRQVTEQGRSNALSTDGNGTVIAFEEDFLGVSSVVGTVETEDPRHVVVSALNPNGFNLWVFDDDGVRRSQLVDWIARGIA